MPLHIKHLIKISLILLSFNFLVLPVEAALLSTSLQGTVTEDNSGLNPFGLNNGNSVFASATYDDAVVVGSSTDEEIFINGLTGWDFTITLGSFSFSQADVNDPTYTSFFFDNGKLDGIRFFLEDIDIDSYAGLLIEDFNGARSLFAEDSDTGFPIYLELDWDFANASTPSAVPLPATTWIFLSGLMGLYGAQKIRRNFSSHRYI